MPKALALVLASIALGCAPGTPSGSGAGGSGSGGSAGSGGTGGRGGTGGTGGSRSTGGGGPAPADAGSGGAGGGGPADSGLPASDAPPAGADAGPDATAPTDTGGADTGDGAPPAAGPWARQLRVGLVEASQSVFIKLGDGATVVATGVRNAELIEGRPMLVRVHIRPDAGFTARSLRGVLTLSYPMATPAAADVAFEETKMLVGASDPEKLETTFNFLVPATAVKPGAQLAAAIYEAGAAMGTDPTTPPRFPATGAADLGVRAGRMVLDVTMVPAVGPGGMVDSSPARRKRVEDHLYDVYPVQKVIVRWHEPLRFTTRISASAGFQALQMTRTQDKASAGTYYHLLLAKEDSTEGYLGIANLAGATMNDGPRRIGITFVTGRVVDSLLDTISHEMGHNHGRNHAPGCNAAGVDMNFPYTPGPGVGVNGYSLSEMKLKTVRLHKDLMGYCNVTWVSDYTWKGFAGRVRAVSAFVPPDGTMAYSPPPTGRTLIGYQSPDDAEPHWTVVPGRLSEAADGVAKVHVRLLSDDRTREITMNLPDKPGAIPLQSIDVPSPSGIGLQRFQLPAEALTLPSR